ncbi:hypothetical protein ACIQPR_44925 [Streptomyces sp. NPDC091280]|uniref:hypothetical protein n=1 Tax=Streptomyces sp. NPDC091280 TaxID=3365984 RepID=UPI0037FBC229
MVEYRVQLRGRFVGLENEWATWQPTDPDSQGRIDAACVLVSLPVAGPPRSPDSTGAVRLRAGQRPRTAGKSTNDTQPAAAATTTRLGM